MTAYVAEAGLNPGTNITNLTLKPGSFQVRIIKVEWLITGGTPTVNVARYLSASITGGTTVTPVPMRSGAAAATVSVKYTATAISGTPTYFQNKVSPANTDYTPVADLIIGLGEVFHVGYLGGSGLLAPVVIYFDELHLARSV